MRNVLFPGAVFLAVFSCHGGGPTSPQPPPMPTAEDGMMMIETARMPHVPVASALIQVVDGSSYRSEVNGMVQLPASAAGKIIEIFAEGHLQPRRLVYIPGMSDYLLPDDNQMSADWIETAFYPRDESYLTRPQGGTVTIELGPSLASSQLFAREAMKGIQHLNQVQTNVDVFIAQSGVVKMVLAPNDPIFSEEKYENAWAVITGEFSDGYIVGSRVVWRYITRSQHHQLDADTIWLAVAHELGHHMGIWGHPAGGVMNQSPVAGLPGYTQQERAALNYLFLRSVGTRWPDDSTWTPSTPLYQRALTETTRVLGCGMAH